MGVAVAGETPSPTGKFGGETHRVLEHTQARPPTRTSAPEGPNLLVGSRGNKLKPVESRASGIVPSLTPPHTVPQCSIVGCPTLVNI